MATLLVAPNGRVVSAARRKSWREAYGDLPSLLAAARDERDAGQLENAYTAYRMALSDWLRARWVEHSGKANTPLANPKSLAEKLVNTGRIDAWVAGVIKATDGRPCPVERVHVDVLAAVVDSLALETEGMS